MAITPLPAAPEVTDTPQEFNTKAFAWVDALDTFVTEANAQATDVNNNTQLAEDWASKTNGQVDSTDYSAKAWAVGGTGVTDTASRGAAKEWATETASTVDGTEYSAKEYAVGTQTRGTTGSAKDWATYTSGTVDGSGYSAKYHANAASGSASAAAASAAAAVQTANITEWSSGATYAAGDNVYSPSDFKTYRNKTGTNTSTDPSLDDTNWEPLTFSLPNQSGQGGKFLTTDGSDVSWATVDTSAAGNDTEIQYNNAGARAGASGLVTDGSNLTIKTQGDIRFGDADDSNYVALQGPATVASNVTWTLPAADGSNGQVLSTNGSGTLSWASGATPGPFTDGTAGSPSITFSADTNTGIFRATTDQIGISTNGTERIRIDNVGNVGINDTTPTEGKLVVRSDANSSHVGLYTLGNASSTQIWSNLIGGTQNANSNSTAYTSQKASLIVSNFGAQNTNNEVANNALILWGANGAAVNPADLMKAYSYGGNSFVFRMAFNGNVTNLNNSYGSISDARLKQDIVDASSQWEDIKRIKVRKFRMIEDVQKAEENSSLGEAPYQIGVIAQELEQVSPGLIEQAKLDDGSPNPESMRQVKYSILYMKAIKALQEAMLRIEVLENKVAVLEGNS